MGDFLCMGLLVHYLLIRLLDIVVGEHETVFNTKCLIVNSKIAALCSCSRSAVLTCIYIHTRTSSCLLESAVN